MYIRRCGHYNGPLKHGPSENCMHKKCVGSLYYISSVSRPVYTRAKKRGRKRGGVGGGEGRRGEKEEEWKEEVYYYLVRWFCLFQQLGHFCT